MWYNQVDGIVMPNGDLSHRPALSNPMKEGPTMGTVRIPLASRKHPDTFALIDEEDLPLLRPYKWIVLVHPHGFRAVHTGRRADGTHFTIYLARLIMGAKSDELVDHKNGDTLDNTRANLRRCTKSENGRNRHNRAPDCSSRYIGVCRTVEGRWSAGVKVHGKKKYLGTYLTQEEAACVRDRAAILAHGEFAALNFPNGNDHIQVVRTHHEWSEGEDRILLAESDKGRFWRKSAARLLGRSVNACSMRRQHLRSGLDKKVEGE
jgi:hypothetical protein